MPKSLSEQSEHEELDRLLGACISIIAYDDGEWFLLFSNGVRLILSAGDEAYYTISEVMH